MIANKLISCYEIAGHSKEINSICFSDNRHLASGSKDKTLKLWTLTTGKLISTINHNEQIRIAFSRDRILATGCSKGNVRLFKPNSKLSSSLQELLN